MRTLVPWSGDLRREMERMSDRFEPLWGPIVTMAGDWAPRLDVSETKDAMVVTADMPGVDPKEIEIGLTGDLLSLKGEKAKEVEEGGRRSVTIAWSGLMERSRAASDCPWRWTEARYRDVQERSAGRTLPKTPAAKGR